MTSPRSPLAHRIARRLLPLGRSSRSALETPHAFAVSAAHVQTLEGPGPFRQALLAQIAQATRRIVLVALYLQDDEAGREVLEALYAASRARPELEIEVYVDWHRARRGLIGKVASEGNAAMYRDYTARCGEGVAIYGVPVQNRELFGVLHLKGFVIDDAVLYSGASINDVYLATQGRYRLDRYHLIRHAGLADSMVAFVQRYLRASEAVQRLDRTPLPATRELQQAIRHLRKELQHAHYQVPREALSGTDIAITPLAGFGRSGNTLNDTLLALLRQARRRVVLFTPYFNLPRPVRAVLGQLLRRGCTIDIMVGDKTANDFYIPPAQPFRKIGLLPYLYESNLRRFARAHRAHMARGQLNLWLWRDGDNSYHVKGLLIDDEIAVITGNNLNPRAWALDLENGLLLRDPSHQLVAQHEAEWAALRRHAVRLEDYHALDNPRRYPAEVRTLLRRLSRVRLDRLLNRLL
ncbi:CDP-diacylglycerol--serine O-phosphatidyltransferase [Dyella caseinilytica]|uniref:CDP-diacylglycerol--serine O-phosphatidyltransferase n=1 Tax=Dyella caseinilytica TaxID=1849581 RepID=A0ABX7GVE9_9GAMM|nr:CDP-diacylglycerol--serine O-phosphatidyltransferase [Dyella caseinilytica]QRN53986.1 CDP-diacylglycerol--serine O-phosphatidyltransferase [Dyella caseinilytica]GFZ90707.1 CDP-diacylglycerol--serine O-phosphatidyltransferase [Dyella caseinilytica]